MTADSFSLNWEAMVTIIGGLFVGGLVAIVWVIRDRRGRSLRVGVFVERDLEQQQDVPSSEEDTKS